MLVSYNLYYDGNVNIIPEIGEFRGITYDPLRKAAVITFHKYRDIYMPMVLEQYQGFYRTLVTAIEDSITIVEMSGVCFYKQDFIDPECEEASANAEGQDLEEYLEDNYGNCRLLAMGKDFLSQDKKYSSYHIKAGTGTHVC